MGPSVAVTMDLSTISTGIGILLAGGGVIYAAGKLGARSDTAMAAHESLGQARFASLQSVCEEIRDDIREMRRQWNIKR